MSETTETTEVHEAKTRDTFMKKIQPIREIVEANCFPYDSAKDRRRLLAMDLDPSEVDSIIERKSAKISERKSSYDRVKLASDLLCALEFFVIEQEEKRLANIAKLSAAK